MLRSGHKVLRNLTSLGHCGGLFLKMTTAGSEPLQDNDEVQGVDIILRPRDYNYT